MALNFPTSPAVGDVYTVGNSSWVWNGVNWASGASLEGTQSPPIVTISDTAPIPTTLGELWWNSSTGQLKLYYDDGTSVQWVDANSSIFTTVNYITSDGESTLTNKTISYVDNTLTGVAPLASPTFTGTVTASTINLGTALGVQYGGTGASSLNSNSVLLGNGTNTVQSVAPSTTGNVLTSNGTTWVSSPPAPSFTTGKAIAMAIVFGA